MDSHCNAEVKPSRTGMNTVRLEATLSVPKRVRERTSLQRSRKLKAWYW